MIFNKLTVVCDGIVRIYRHSHTADVLGQAGRLIAGEAGLRQAHIEALRTHVKGITGVPENEKAEFQRLAFFGLAEVAAQQSLALWLQRAAGSATE